MTEVQLKTELDEIKTSMNIISENYTKLLEYTKKQNLLIMKLIKIVNTKNFEFSAPIPPVVDNMDLDINLTDDEDEDEDSE